jgi:hypothetical protein
MAAMDRIIEKEFKYFNQKALGEVKKVLDPRSGSATLF